MPPKTNKKRRARSDSPKNVEDPAPLIMDDLASSAVDDPAGDTPRPAASPPIDIPGVDQEDAPVEIPEWVLEGPPEIGTSRVKTTKKKKKKKANLAKEGITVVPYMNVRDELVPCVRAKDGHLYANHDIKIGERLFVFSPLVMTPVHPHEGVADKDGHVRLDHTTGVHMLQMFAACGYTWEAVARRLMPGCMIEAYMTYFKEDASQVASGGAATVGATIGTLMVLLKSTDEWVVKQLGAIQTNVSASLILQGADRWLYAVIHGMRVSNTHSVVDPILNHGPNTMATYAGLTRVYSTSFLPTNFNAILMVDGRSNLHVFAMRPIPTNCCVVVALSDGMAVDTEDITNGNILNLLMALRKMGGELIESRILGEVVAALGAFDVPNTDCLPAALRAHQGDREMVERIRDQLMHLDAFKRNLQAYRMRSQKLQSSAKAKVMAIHDTVVAILGTITLHTKDPSVWLDHQDVLDDDIVPVNDEDDVVDDFDMAVVDRVIPVRKVQHFPPVGVTSFREMGKSEDVSAYCMFMAVLMCEAHATLDAASLPWIPDGVYATLCNDSTIAGVSDDLIGTLVGVKVQEELDSVKRAFDGVDVEFIEHLAREVHTMGAVEQMNEMAKLATVLEACSDEAVDENDDEVVEEIDADALPCAPAPDDDLVHIGSPLPLERTLSTLE